ncbi:MAG: hypothetical protein M3150_02880 [Pseudomonadota bacterium]|nr:hypothetical protein [Pseudomonadota bacterium]
MKPDDLQQHAQWVLARRAEKMNPSLIREILKVIESPFSPPPFMKRRRSRARLGQTRAMLRANEC